MIKYAIILLDDTSTAYCHADNPLKEGQLMPINTLRDAVFWCMKENLNIQFVYPDYELSNEYLSIIDSVDHADIKHLGKADVTVFNGWEELNLNNLKSPSIVLRLTKKELLCKHERYQEIINYDGHVSIVITDVEEFAAKYFDEYQKLLSKLSISVESQALIGRLPQINILTDRMHLSEMNNCNAGYESITIAPNGRFYVCPAFYYDDEKNNIGSLRDGLKIKNGQLYKLNYAPICRNCDAYQCRRCIWLNKKMTLEVNTPSHEQCVLSHIERNATRDLLNNIRKHVEFLPKATIGEIDYLDPFEKFINK